VKAAPFTYSAPRSLDEVVDTLVRYDDEAKLLAGGQSLVPVLAMRLSRFEHLVDLQHVPDLTGVSRSDGAVRIGAMTTHSAVGQAGEAAAVPLLSQAAPFIGHGAIRNRGTLGGSLAHADPAGEWPAVAVALDAELEAVGPDGPRMIPAAEFFLGTWTSSLEPAEVLVAAHFPVWEGACGFAVEEAARRHGDYAMAGVVCGVQLDGGRVTRAAVALLGVGSTPIRATAAEQALIGTSVADVDATAFATAVVSELDPPDDLHASGEQRRRMSCALAERAVRNAIAAANGEDQRA
jgi:carbon-monoxide dehydrogenase medium subunit